MYSVKREDCENLSQSSNILNRIADVDSENLHAKLSGCLILHVPEERQGFEDEKTFGI